MLENKALRVLVTGCGGDIGQSIGKILAISSWVSELHGLDISDQNAAKFIFPNFGLISKVTDPSYLFKIRTYIEANNIDLVIPISEPELREYSLNNWTAAELGTKVLLANVKAMSIGFDKLKTAHFLSENGFEFPKTFSLSAYDTSLDLPVILKSRTGSGSKSIMLARSEKELDFYKEVHQDSDFIIQEFIPGEEGEYTCGLFRSRQGEVRSIIFKRQLMGGFSGFGEVEQSERISELLSGVAESLQLVGSINVQLRLHNGIPYIFEINPRFSSTVYFRFLFGFDDLHWSIADLFGASLSPYSVKEGYSRFYKGFNEYVD